MAAELTMPKLSDSMAEAIIVRWLKSPGDAFTRGEALIEVETDKATVVYEAESDGTLDTILVPEGGTAAVGQLIATLANGPSPGSPPPAPAPAPVRREASGRTRPLWRGGPRSSSASRSTASPAPAPGGRITRDDVQKAPQRTALRRRLPRRRPGAAATSSGRADGDAGDDRTPDGRVGDDRSRLHGLGRRRHVACRRASRAARARSGTTCRPSTTSWSRPPPRRCASCLGSTRPTSKDGSSCTRASTSGSRSRSTTRCSSRSCSTPTRRRWRRSPPRRAASRTAPAAVRSARRSCATARSPSRISGCSASAAFTAIVDAPQAAILAVGGVRRAPVEDAAGGVSFRDVMTATLSCDHRVVYGADGARFLSRLRELLERPLLLLA